MPNKMPPCAPNTSARSDSDRVIPGSGGKIRQRRNFLQGAEVLADQLPGVIGDALHGFDCFGLQVSLGYPAQNREDWVVRPGGLCRQAHCFGQRTAENQASC
jgi:hypothetical protein